MSLFLGLGNLKVTCREFDLDSGFFWVGFEGERYLLCCLERRGNLNDGFFFIPAVKANDCGYDEGICRDNNYWAFEDQTDYVREFIVKQAELAGLEII